MALGGSGCGVGRGGSTGCIRGGGFPVIPCSESVVVPSKSGQPAQSLGYKWIRGGESAEFPANFPVRSEQGETSQPLTQRSARMHSEAVQVGSEKKRKSPWNNAPRALFWFFEDRGPDLHIP